MKIEIKNETPDTEAFKELRKSIDWPLPADEAIKLSLDNTEFCVTAFADDKLAGMGRLVGDKCFIYFIADIIVKPEYQGNKIGFKIMTEIMEYLNNHAPKNSYITLMAAKGKELFYEKFGFFKRPNEKFGCGMMVEIR